MTRHPRYNHRACLPWKTRNRPGVGVPDGGRPTPDPGSLPRQCLWPDRLRSKALHVFEGARPGRAAQGRGFFRGAGWLQPLPAEDGGAARVGPQQHTHPMGPLRALWRYCILGGGIGRMEKSTMGKNKRCLPWLMLLGTRPWLAKQRSAYGYGCRAEPGSTI